MKKEQNLNNAEKQALNIPVVSGSILITNAATNYQRSLIPKSDWFDNDYYKISINDDCIVFQKCYLEIPKGAYKLPKTGVFTILAELPLGTFEIDEESTEDELVVYYR